MQSRTTIDLLPSDVSTLNFPVDGFGYTFRNSELFSDIPVKTKGKSNEVKIQPVESVLLTL